MSEDGIISRGTQPEQMALARNVLSGIINDIEAETNRGDLSTLEQSLYCHTLRAAIVVMNIRSLNLRFPNDDG